MRVAIMKSTPGLNELLWGFVSLMAISDLVYSDDLSCPKITFPNGWVKYAGRRGSQFARFVCKKDYDLVGGKYAKCKNGMWDTAEPFCTKPGCKPLLPLANGMQFNLSNRTQVMFFCHPKYHLDGPTRALCDGEKWNVVPPTCQPDQNEQPLLSCDFETRSICGWINDPEHDFDWRRKCLGTPSGFLGTGPSYDHTHGIGQLGYYMYIESTSRLENETARLISPLYGGNYSQNACFVFYYHMYGKTTGSLRVYVHPENVDFKKVMDDTTTTYKKFEKRGNQGRFWLQGFFDLTPMETNFQIVVEGVRGSSHTSDIAIDDVSILQGVDCDRERPNIELTTPALLIIKDSCLNRCGSNAFNQTFDGENVECQCHLACDVDENCCDDYNDLCVFGLEFGRKSFKTFKTTPDDNYRTTEADKFKLPMLPTPQKATATKIPNIDIIKNVSVVNQNITDLPQSTTEMYNPSTTNTTVIPKIFRNITLPTIQKKNGTSLDVIPIVFENYTKYEVDKSNVTIKNNGTTQSPDKFSKHYGHYGRDDDGKVKITTSVYDDSDEVIVSKNFSKINMEKITSLAQDLSRKNESRISPITIVLILIGVTLLVVIPVVIRFNKDCNLSKRFTDLHQRWTRTGSVSDNQADMRFLVKDEELENYVD